MCHFVGDAAALTELSCLLSLMTNSDADSPFAVWIASLVTAAERGESGGCVDEEGEAGAIDELELVNAGGRVDDEGKKKAVGVYAGSRGAVEDDATGVDGEFESAADGDGRRA